MTENEKDSLKKATEALKTDINSKESGNYLVKKEKNENIINYLGVDPGSFKTGLALVDSTGRIVKQKTVLTENFDGELFAFLEKEEFSKTVIIGDGTYSINIQTSLNKVLMSFESDLKVKKVNEKNSTLEARKLYWQVTPRSWWRKIIPLGLQTPPVEIDGYAAVILVRRYLKTKNKRCPKENK